MAGSDVLGVLADPMFMATTRNAFNYDHIERAMTAQRRDREHAGHQQPARDEGRGRSA